MRDAARSKCDPPRAARVQALAGGMAEIFKMQREFAALAGPGRYPDGAEERVSALCTAIMHEAVELQRLTNWKWWKAPVRFDRSAAKEELIDIWHFVVQASIELGMGPDDVVKEYRRKNGINRRRQKEGY